MKRNEKLGAESSELQGVENREPPTPAVSSSHQIFVPGRAQGVPTTTRDRPETPPWDSKESAWKLFKPE